MTGDVEAPIPELKNEMFEENQNFLKALRAMTQTWRPNNFCKQGQLSLLNVGYTVSIDVLDLFQGVDAINYSFDIDHFHYLEYQNSMRKNNKLTQK